MALSWIQTYLTHRSYTRFASLLAFLVLADGIMPCKCEPGLGSWTTSLRHLLFTHLLWLIDWWLGWVVSHEKCGTSDNDTATSDHFMTHRCYCIHEVRQSPGCWAGFAGLTGTSIIEMSHCYPPANRLGQCAAESCYCYDFLPFSDVLLATTSYFNGHFATKMVLQAYILFGTIVKHTMFLLIVTVSNTKYKKYIAYSTF